MLACSERIKGLPLSPGLGSLQSEDHDLSRSSQRQSALVALRVNHDYRQHLGGVWLKNGRRGGGLKAVRLLIVTYSRPESACCCFE